MQKRGLGKTGLEVSVIGLGGIPIQRFDQATANQVIEACLDQGINFIDTARGYGASEALLGQAMAGKRNQFIIATKSPAKTYEDMKADIDKSLKDLQTDVIDLYQCHFIKDQATHDLITGPGGAYQALKEAKDQGKIKHIGCTAHNADVLTYAIETGLWETIQFPFNFVEVQGLKLFERAHDLGIGILVMKPLAGGAIGHVDLSLRFIVDNPHISVAIPGMESRAQVEQNAKAGLNPNPLSQEERDFIQNFRATTDQKFCRRCGYCGPCPENIDIPLMFTLEGYLNRYDLKDWANMRYKGTPVKASACTKCGLCEPKCPYDLPIRDMLEKVALEFKA